MIKIMGLGPGNPEAITIGTINELQKSKNIFFRTKIHPTVTYINEINISYETYDYFYEESKSFEEVYQSIARDLILKHEQLGDIVYAVPGHPLVAEKSVTNLIELCEKQNIEYKITPAVSFMDAVIERLKIDPIEGLKVIDAFDIANQTLDNRVGTIITQVYNPLIASEVKLKLCDIFGDESEIIYCRAVGIDSEERIVTIPLYELDMQKDIDYLTSVYIPKGISSKKDLKDLVNLVDILRGKDGCPWDKEQTHDSIKKAIVEESYEVLDAINNHDYDGLVEELGDVLFQIVFHASIENEDGYFNLSDIIEGIYNKMVYRHPHVFDNKTINSTGDVLKNWDELKNKEKNFNNISEELDGIAKALPALIRAEKVQNKAKKYKFEFEKVEDIIEKIQEELFEVKDVYKTKEMDKIKEEIGDLIFSCVNLARFLDINSEDVLNISTNKFIKRILLIEDMAKEEGVSIKDLSSKQIDKLWCKLKNIEKQ